MNTPAVVAIGMVCGFMGFCAGLYLGYKLTFEAAIRQIEKLNRVMGGAKP